MTSYEEQLQTLITQALEEDIGEGDHSTLSTISPNQTGLATLFIKEDGILAGVEVAKAIFREIEAEATFTVIKKDGETMKPGEKAFTIQAYIHTILTCERIVLNAMQRMSGIATLTHKYVQRLGGYHTRLLDTRKTTPNFRLLEKEAVRIGGGTNHRMGLYDMIMLKDNHIDYCGGITEAIEKAYTYKKEHRPLIKIEVETRNIEDVKKALATQKVDRIMLDNFAPELIVEALKIIDGACETEASGGINYDNLQAYAATGVDYISSGAIIHQARSLDLSLKATLS